MKTYNTCDKCNNSNESVRNLFVKSEQRVVTLCDGCRITLLECMFDWDWTGDCVETSASLHEFMTAYPVEQE